jgi:hypothetical protein
VTLETKKAKIVELGRAGQSAIEPGFQFPGASPAIWLEPDARLASTRFASRPEPVLRWDMWIFSIQDTELLDKIRFRLFGFPLDCLRLIRVCRPKTPDRLSLAKTRSGSKMLGS